MRLDQRHTYSLGVAQDTMYPIDGQYHLDDTYPQSEYVYMC